MSFVDQDDIIALMEDILAGMWGLIGEEIPRPIPRMTYAEAMSKYGSDKPDLRMGLELVECTDFFAETPFRVFQADYVGAVVMPGGASQPRKIGRAHVCTPVTNAHFVCRLLLENKKTSPYPAII